jgi:hypothetical protein
MKTFANGILGLFVGLLCGITSAQTAGLPPAVNARQPHAQSQGQPLRSSMYEYLASEEGRAWMQVSGNPKSKALNQRFGQPSPAALERARVLLRNLSEQSPKSQTTLPAEPSSCGGAAGVRFNLEPRTNAVLQIQPSADFILNGAGAGSDLIVQIATDARGNLNNGTWDGSLSGYYVHTSSTADCSVQFEGGLPSFNNTSGLGAVSVVADPVRGAFFASDNRFVDGGAIFRVSTADLLNPAKCPPGTHTEAQAESCWMQTPPVQIDPTYQSYIDPVLAVDERASGTGAGDVYLVGEGESMFIVACTNLLNCSPIENIDTNNGQEYAFVQVRPDGIITISYMRLISGGLSETVLYVTCTPAGAPKPPVCGSPVTVATATSLAAYQPPNLGPVGSAYAQHINRLESDGSFTTFLVYDGCTNLYTPPPPPNDPPTYCVGSSVFMSFSTNNGQTWSPPVSVDNKNGFHVFPTITNDASTGNVGIVHLSNEGDYFEHDTRVVVNRILPGTTTLSPSVAVTSFTSNTNFPALGIGGGADSFMGAAARGTGIAGQSHLYLSFDSIAVDGMYNGEALPELNNQIKLIVY